MEQKNKKPKIKVYSTPTCPYCQTLKEFLKEKGFKFDDIDVSADDKAREYMIEKSGQMGVPVIEIDGEIIVGFERSKINKKLGIKE